MVFTTYAAVRNQVLFDLCKRFTPPNPLLLKTKTKTYVLLVLVMGVWAAVAYKIVVALNPKLPELATNNFTVTHDFKLETSADTFSIPPVERDPFLGTVARPKKPKATAEPALREYRSRGPSPPSCG